MQNMISTVKESRPDGSANRFFDLLGVVHQNDLNQMYP